MASRTRSGFPTYRVSTVGLFAVAAGVALYFFVRDEVREAVGLGAPIVAVWLLALLLALASRPSTQRRANLWLASVAVVVLALGTLGLFEANRGALGWFTVYGEVSLGGDVGQAIVGETTWLGVLRLLGVLVVGAAAAAPARARDLAREAGRRAPFVYAYLLSAARSITSWYRSRRTGPPKEPRRPVVDRNRLPDPTPGPARAGDWERPSIELVRDEPGEEVTEEELGEQGEIIRRTLAEFDIEVEVGKTVGPGQR